MSYPVIDGHLDLLLFVDEYRKNGETSVIPRHFLPAIREGNVQAIVASIFIEDIYLPEMGLRRALDQISMMLEELSESEEITLCTNATMIREALEEGKVAFLLSLEGADPLGNDLYLLKVFHQLGVRLLGLTWSRRNYLADGCYYRPVEQGKMGGVTPFGLKVVRKAIDLGIILDVSHLNDAGVEDLLDFTSVPLIASHSNARALTPSLRNLTDDQIIRLADRGGIIGINAANFFVAEHDEQADRQRLLNHLDHLIHIGGIDHVGFGFDLCGVVKNQLSEQTHRAFPRPHFDVIRGYEEVPLLIQDMHQRGYNEAAIRKVTSENWMRVFDLLD